MLSFEPYEHLFLADVWMGTGLVSRVSPQIQKDVLELPGDELRQIKIVGVCGTWSLN